MDFGYGIGVDTGIDVSKDGVEVKLLGTGFAFTKEKIEICIEICIVVKLGKEHTEPPLIPTDLYADDSTTRTLIMIQEWHSDLMLRAAKRTPEHVLQELSAIVLQARRNIERMSGGQNLASLCKSKDKKLRHECDVARDDLILTPALIKTPLVKKFNQLNIKKGVYVSGHSG